MAKYKVLQPLRHDGEPYAPGADVDMPPKAASQLVAAGVLAPTKAVPTEKAASKTGKAAK